MSKYDQTSVHPLALALTLAMCVMILFARRDRAVIPVLVVACLVTHAQRIVVGGLDFSMLRVVVVFGWIRILYRRETGSFRFQPMDAALPIWLFFGTLAYIFGPRGSVDAFVQRLGVTVDAAGIYFLFRVLLRDVDDVRQVVRVFGWMALVIVGPMIVENLTGRNVFAALGGVPEETRIRGGRLRCQASFSHPIMAGNFGASTLALLVPLFLAFPRERLRHGLAMAAAATVTILSASGGPVVALGTALLGWGLWPLRRHMRLIRWGGLAGMIFIHFFREQPIWHLIGRASRITGGTGWHRVQLIDAFFEHVDEWWLLGTYSTVHWKSRLGSDITNQYILEAVRGGLATLLSFIAILVIGFRTVGRCLRRARANGALPRNEARQAALLAWGLGVCLAAHTVAFLAVSYFGQLQSILYLHLAMIPSLFCALARSRARVSAARAHPPHHRHGGPDLLDSDAARSALR